MSDLLPELRDIESQIWTQLCESAAGKSASWRLPVMATASASGPRARTIVLRGVRRAERQLLFHTDMRSPKVEQLQRDDRVSLVFYDSGANLQAVIQGRAHLHNNDAVADLEWKSTPVSSRRAYLAPFAPGQLSGQPEPNLPKDLIGRLPTEAELKPGRCNFQVIVVTVEQIDWLQLNQSSNLRAAFEYSGAGDDVSATWIAC